MSKVRISNVHGSYVVKLFKQKAVSQKWYFCYRDTTQQYFL